MYTISDTCRDAILPDFEGSGLIAAHFLYRNNTAQRGKKDFYWLIKIGAKYFSVFIGLVCFFSFKDHLSG